MERRSPRLAAASRPVASLRRRQLGPLAAHDTAAGAEHAAQRPAACAETSVTLVEHTHDVEHAHSLARSSVDRARTRGPRRPPARTADNRSSAISLPNDTRRSEMSGFLDNCADISDTPLWRFAAANAPPEGSEPFTPGLRFSRCTHVTPSSWPRPTSARRQNHDRRVDQDPAASRGRISRRHGSRFRR